MKSEQKGEWRTKTVSLTVRFTPVISTTSTYDLNPILTLSFPQSVFYVCSFDLQTLQSNQDGYSHHEILVMSFNVKNMTHNARATVHSLK